MKQVLLQLIKIGASLPVGLKGGIIEKVLRRIQHAYIKSGGKDVIISSNMGINNKFRVALPVLKAPPYFLFGTPFSYKGEYHTLQLANFLNQYCNAFVDIGANWGFYSYYIAAHNDNKPIFWFEPNPELYNNITDNLARNKFNSVRGSDLGLSDTDGVLTFYLNPSSDLVSSIVPPENQDGVVKQTINTTRFDSWAMSNGIPDKLMVKVDVENAEWQFIRGAEKALDKIEYLIMEVLGPARQSGFINYVINDLQLKAYYIDNEKIEYVAAEDMRYTKGEYNWLFCRQRPEELSQKLSGSIFKVIQ
jgi:FkbM family methyltransferase